MKKAVVLLNMGGPNNLEEVELFLKNMFNDENIIPIKNRILRKFVSFMITNARKKEARENYEKLGGKSPIVGITEKLVEKLSSKLGDTDVTFAMRYTPPFAKDVIKELKKKDITDVYLIPLYPQYSFTTTKSSLEDFEESAKKEGMKARIHKIERFYKNEKFNETVIEKIKECIKDIDEKEYDLIFSAHSLPKKMIEKGDPYQKEITEHVEILKELLKKNGIEFKNIHIAYQSKLGPVEWLEPGLDDKLKEIENRKVVIYPLSFTIDNSETVYELHIEYKEIAKELGFEDYRVCECPNESDTFCEALRDIYKGM
ncbi:ferrochelatase [Nitrosophilus alvini]|uniref:ferrochelatase n=1 Tax=Nitrosophilus alvini TaxID=2714855 RepID=UPI00190DCA5D|nr:ferrochelatase [Nitrosophilus alvini]